MSKKETNIITDALSSASQLFRHRQGINIPNLPFIEGRRIDEIKLGKKIFYLNNQIPALIQDTFDNLGYEQRDGTKPIIVAKRKTEYGWHLVINLPAGVSFKDIKNHKHYFEDATNSWIEIEKKKGKCHMEIQSGELPDYIEYGFEPSNYPDMYLPIPIGYSRTKLIILELPDSPHLLIGGATGGGKTSLINSIIHSVIHQAIVIMIDLKGIDFAYLEDKILLATTNQEALTVLSALEIEYQKRKKILIKYKAKKWLDCPENLPYIVLIIDELAQLDKDCMSILNSLVALARATGISIIAASQRTSVQVINGDTRSNFLARICFRVGSEVDSRVVLGEDCGLAGQLPAVKGRAIYRFGLDTLEVQTMYLDDNRAEELLINIPPMKGGINIAKVRESETKRLSPR